MLCEGLLKYLMWLKCGKSSNYAGLGFRYLGNGIEAMNMIVFILVVRVSEVVHGYYCKFHEKVNCCCISNVLSGLVLQGDLFVGTSWATYRIEVGDIDILGKVLT